MFFSPGTHASEYICHDSKEKRQPKKTKFCLSQNCVVFFTRRQECCDKNKRNIRKKLCTRSYSYQQISASTVLKYNEKKKKNWFWACQSKHFFTLSLSPSHLLSSNFILLICIPNELWFVMVCTRECECVELLNAATPHRSNIQTKQINK